MAEWFETKKSTPPDGSIVLGYWPQLDAGSDMSVVRYTHGAFWSADPEDAEEYSDPSYWMSLPSRPNQGVKP